MSNCWRSLWIALWSYAPKPAGGDTKTCVRTRAMLGVQPRKLCKHGATYHMCGSAERRRGLVGRASALAAGWSNAPTRGSTASASCWCVMKRPLPISSRCCNVPQPSFAGVCANFIMQLYLRISSYCPGSIAWRGNRHQTPAGLHTSAHQFSILALIISLTSRVFTSFSS
jgi:hypothetical protein